MKVLIAEDNRLNRISLTSFLEEIGMEVMAAKDGEEAYKLWETFLPQVLITDLQMPKIDGISLIKKIRQNDNYNYTFIIVVTADKNLEVLEKSFEVGADDYISKPFKKIELQHRVKAAERLIGLFENEHIVYALAQLTETRDLDTGKHIERLSAYSKVLASALKNNPKYSKKISNRFLDNIAISSVLHDIGKVGIPDSILTKPGVFTKDEREIMKEHTMIGFKTIQSIAKKYPKIKYLETAGEIARWHHERFDGTGYPDGLKGENIPVSARIVAVADVYDALRSHRVYKKALTHEESKAVLIEGSGTHFDPDIIDAFLSVENYFSKTKY
ncbi:HD domain-containing phosphohydrolase [Mariniplasma anaerobium]|uniref:Two-component system response regulator n=1 Tax=Mariniplasma anaerobium TaxID=2735436 RepID=A0A7U9XW90_9MOLU|nr:HD domain-containing phosphohydrolase [Mariniplasma anaerobium]BCR35531.1 two-component system response regulator [Mariniplasma anaerobium]